MSENGIPVARYRRNQIMGDKDSPQLYYLKKYPGSSRTRSLESIGSDIEQIGAMSQDDITHVIRSLIRRMKIALTEGDQVKIPGLGTFHITFNCKGTEEEKDCTVRNIHKVNIRFKVDNTLRLANDTTATTRGAANNVKFYIKGETTSADGVTDGDDDNHNWQDPDA